MNKSKSEVASPAAALSPAEIRALAERWWESQVATLAMIHGKDWPEHRDWIEDYLEQELRERLLVLGWGRKG